MAPPAVPFFDGSVTGVIETLADSAVELHALEVSNPNNAQDVFLQLFDAAAPVLGTTAPSLSLIVPGGTATARGAMDKFFAHPILFRTALKYAVTTTPTGAVSPGSAVTLNAVYLPKGT